VTSGDHFTLPAGKKVRCETTHKKPGEEMYNEAMENMGGFVYSKSVPFQVKKRQVYVVWLI